MMTMKPAFKVYPYLVFALLLCLIGGCGGGGGGNGDDFIGAGVVSISASPSRIDAGDRTRVTVEIRDAHPDGVALKVFFPAGLIYVPNSSRLYVDDADQSVTPALNRESHSGVYLVYYFTQRIFGDQNRGTLTFELEGTSRVRDDHIGADIDVDDPLIDNAEEFDINNPQYEAETETGIEVLG